MAETESFRRSRVAFYRAQVRKKLIRPEDVPPQYRGYGTCGRCGGSTLPGWTMCRNCENDSAQKGYRKNKTRWQEIKKQKVAEERESAEQRMEYVKTLIRNINNKPEPERVPISKAIQAALHPPSSKRNFRFFKRPGFCKRCDIRLTSRFATGAKYGFCGPCRVQTPQSKTG